jgi:hypothetical protein
VRPGALSLRNSLGVSPAMDAADLSCSEPSRITISTPAAAGMSSRQEHRRGDERVDAGSTADRTRDSAATAACRAGVPATGPDERGGEGAEPRGACCRAEDECSSRGLRTGERDSEAETVATSMTLPPTRTSRANRAIATQGLRAEGTDAGRSVAFRSLIASELAACHAHAEPCALAWASRLR